MPNFPLLSSLHADEIEETIRICSKCPAGAKIPLFKNATSYPILEPEILLDLRFPVTNRIPGFKIVLQTTQVCSQKQG